MNERIKELATEAELELTIETKKFAELIVAECASIVDLYGRWILYDKLAVKIKQHFGVTYD
jgi:hypothetical protein